MTSRNQFSRCIQLTDQSLTKMIHNIYYYLTNLQTLNLDFSKCLRITNNGLIDLAAGIKSQASHLQSLELNFSVCNIDVSGFKELISQIAKHLKGLEKLNLNFSLGKIPDDEKDKIRVLLKDIPEFKLV